MLKKKKKRHFNASNENLHGYKEKTAEKCIREGAGKGSQVSFSPCYALIWETSEGALAAKCF